MRTRGTPGPIQSFIVDDLVTFTAPDVGSGTVRIEVNADAPQISAPELDSGPPAGPPAGPSPNRYQRRRAMAESRRRKTPGRRRS